MVQLEIGTLLRAVVKPNPCGWVATKFGTVLEQDPNKARGPLVDPETRTMLEYRGSLCGTEYVEFDTLTGGDVLPVFTYRVADFFM
jgi:hypothetical protein